MENEECVNSYELRKFSFYKDKQGLRHGIDLTKIEKFSCEDPLKEGFGSSVVVWINGQSHLVPISWKELLDSLGKHQREIDSLIK